MLRLSDHLIPSVGNQTVGTKPWALPRECRQGGPARGRREEARSHDQAGWRFGRDGGRASCASAKSVLSAPIQRGLAVAQTVTHSPIVSVLHVVMPGFQRVLITGELSQRPSRSGWVTEGYKLAMKGLPHALATGTASHWPCPWRTQQRHSTSATRKERLYHPRSVVPGTVGKVSLAAAAILWPAGTSSWQPAFRLRNVPSDRSQNRRPKLMGWRLA